MRAEYLLVLGAILIFPLILSFDRKLGLYRHTPSLAKAIAAASVPFWIWDVAVTARGHWSFNDRYVLGVTILGMPLEEWLFFIVVSFVAVFTWESTKHLLREKK
jgi:lycopene beta-cyclase